MMMNSMCRKQGEFMIDPIYLIFEFVNLLLKEFQLVIILAEQWL